MASTPQNKLEKTYKNKPKSNEQVEAWNFLLKWIFKQIFNLAVPKPWQM